MNAQELVPEDVYYARHFRLPGFGTTTQDKLRNAKVLIVGLGGLGCPAALYLATAGVGHLVLCDGDTVSATNLHRQILFSIADIGLKKVEVAAERLREKNPHIKVSTIDKFIDEQGLAAALEGVDVVVDGTDNFSAKFLINDVCERAGIPLVYGSIFQFEGQVSVFHLPSEGKARYSYRDLFPEPPPPGFSQNCGEAGVVGVLPGVVGTLQAAEAIKIVSGLGEPLSGKLLIFDALTGSSDTLSIARKQRVALTENPVPSVMPEALERQLSSATPPTLLDVRDANERQRASLGGLHIPVAEVPKRLSELPQEGEIVVYCASGGRSAKVVLYLQEKLPGARIASLSGGLSAYLEGLGSCAFGAHPAP